MYFYAIVGLAASIAFFASPAKPWLVRRLEQRNRSWVAGTAGDDGQQLQQLQRELLQRPAAPTRTVSQSEGERPMTLGMPEDLLGPDVYLDYDVDSGGLVRRFKDGVGAPMKAG